MDKTEGMIIENGFYIDSCSVYGLHQKAMDLRKELQPQCDKKVCLIVSELVTSIFDQQYCGISSKVCDANNGSPINIAGRLFMDQHTGQMLNNSVFQWKFTLVIYPFEDKLLGVVYSNQAQWISDFMDQDYVNEYSLNDIIRSEIGEERYETRKKEWGQLFEHFSGSSALNSITVEITDPQIDFITPENLIANAPSLERRINACVETSVVSSFGDELEWTPQSLKEWTETEEGKTTVADLSEEFAKRLKKEITIEDLTTSKEQGDEKEN